MGGNITLTKLVMLAVSGWAASWLNDSTGLLALRWWSWVH